MISLKALDFIFRTVNYNLLWCTIGNVTVQEKYASLKSLQFAYL